MSRVSVFVLAASVFAVPHAKALSVGDKIVKKVVCRSGAPVDYLNTVSPGFNLTARYGNAAPYEMTSIVDSRADSYKESRPPCPLGDTIEVFAAAVEQLSCFNQSVLNPTNAEKIVDLDFAGKVEIFEGVKHAGTYIFLKFKADDPAAPCADNGSFAIRLSLAPKED